MNNSKFKLDWTKIISWVIALGLDVLTIVFVVLKLTGKVSWSWWIVFLPILAPILLCLFICGIYEMSRRYLDHKRPKTYYLHTVTGQVVDSKEVTNPDMHAYFAVQTYNGCKSFIDKYEEDGKYVDIAYTEDNSWKTDYHTWRKFIEQTLLDNGLTPDARLVSRFYPEQLFEEMLQAYYDRGFTLADYYKSRARHMS